MAATEDAKPQTRPRGERHRSKKLPKNARVEKRPLFRPPIPSKNASASSPKVVYLSGRTPFISAVKRVRKLLALADKRAVQSATSHIAKDDPKRTEKLAGVAVERGEEEYVWVKGSGRCVQKALQLAVYFQAQGDVRVRLRTSSVWAVDDVVVDEDGDDDGEEGKDEEEVPETRMRQVSVFEVGVCLS